MLSLEFWGQVLVAFLGSAKQMLLVFLYSTQQILAFLYSAKLVLFAFLYSIERVL